jgi:hypothetical protein
MVQLVNRLPKSGTTQKPFCVLILMLCTLSAQATDTPMLERTITITLKQERIDVALKKIAEQGGFVFSYNPSIIDARKIVNLSFVNETIREVLNELFDGAISYKERRKYVILTRATEKESRVVKGYVVDDKTGERLKNVSVYDPITLSSAVTDSYGYFQMKVDKPTSDLILAVNRENYTDTIVAVASWRGLLKIPIKNSTQKIVTMTDSVRSKIKRFWNTKFLMNENLINISDTIYRKYQVSVFPYVGTNHKLSGNVINDYSFNIYGGYSLGVRVMEIGGTFNLVRGDVRGVQIAGSFNGVNGKVKGFQVAGGVNANRDSVRGGQLGAVNVNWNSVRNFSAAGLLNITRNESYGMIMAGLGNVTMGEQKGAHVAGLFNVSTKNTKSLQLAGLINFTAGNLKGGQIGGLANVAVKDALGVQSAGLCNVTLHKMKGAQVAGFLNYAKKIRGVQLGFINVADSVDGVSIGFLSFVLKGYHKLEVSADEIFYTNLAFRTGTHRFYNIFTAGMKPENSENNYWTVGYGIGTAPKLNKWLSLNIDVTVNQVSYGSFTEAINLLNKFYVGLDLKIVKNVSVAVGATLNGYLTDTTYDAYANLFTDYQPKIISDRTYGNDVNLKMWMGGKVGLRFF